MYFTGETNLSKATKINFLYILTYVNIQQNSYNKKI